MNLSIKLGDLCLTRIISSLVIKEINTLEEPISPQRLIKVSDNKPIKTNAAVQSHPIVYYNSKFKILKRDLDPKKMIHKYIKKIIEAQQYTERDIENILEYSLYNSDYEFVERQPTLKEGRIDILYKTKDSYVIELKKGIANISTLDQINTYVENVKKEYNVSNVKGIIICETATERARARNTKPNNKPRITQIHRDIHLQSLMSLGV